MNFGVDIIDQFVRLNTKESIMGNPENNIKPIIQGDRNA